MTNSPSRAPTRSEGEPLSVADGQVRVSILIHLPQLLWELGCDPADILARAGVDPELLADPENTIEYRAGGRLIEHSVASTGCRHLGLLLGEKSELSDLGVVGLLVRHSANVGTALRNLVRLLHLHDRGGVPTLEVTGETALLGFAVYERETPATDQIHAAALVHANKIMRALCGPGWRADEVLLSFRRPADIEPFRRAFGAPMTFDAERCALAFPAALLGAPVATANPAACRSLEALVAVLQGRSRVGTVAATRRALCALLLSGHASESAVAQALAVHRRTLNRRLRSEGSSLRQVLGEVRFETAQQMLRDSDAPVDRIARSLGYSSASAFGRAFRRWTRASPRAWRERANGGGRRPLRTAHQPL
jgi:AraC-like DNA-binding protein